MGLALAFEVNCGSVSGDGTGSGGSGGTGGGQSGGTGGGQSGGAGQTGKGGGSGGNAGTHGGGGGQAGAGATSGTGGQGGEVVGTGGAGGAHASGGGAGGDHASGGAAGHASGGAGGHASGGAGSGGHAGATGGGGAGGAAATGGGGQGGGQTCAELANDYSAALPAAEACTPGAANQCQQLVPLTLSICTGCQHYVNDPTTLNAIRAQWTSQGCDQTTALIVCPAIACINPGNVGNCVATDGAAPGGICGNGIFTPNP